MHKAKHSGDSLQVYNIYSALHCRVWFLRCGDRWREVVTYQHAARGDREAAHFCLAFFLPKHGVGVCFLLRGVMDYLDDIASTSMKYHVGPIC